MDIGGKQYIELLGIDKPEEWILEQNDKCMASIAEKAEVLGRMVQQFLAEKDPTFLMIVHAGDFHPTLMNMTKLFYLVGYLKGKTEQESTIQLDAMWEKGVEDERLSQRPEA